MAGVLLPFMKWFVGGSDSKGPRILNRFVRSPWPTIDVVGQVRVQVLEVSSVCDHVPSDIIFCNEPLKKYRQMFT